MSALKHTWLAAALLLCPVRARAAPVVLELFTSQSCSSCPPADALLTELAARPNVLALDLHVDYWNGIGWHDPYSQAAFTARQQAYAARFGDADVYTPELVVSGQRGVVGSDRRAVEAAMAHTPAAAVAVRLTRADGRLSAAIGPGSGAAQLWLVGYDPHHVTAIRGGENGGRTLAETNVVRSFTAVGAWSGEAMHLNLQPPSGQRAAILLQADTGGMLGAATERQ